MRPTTEPRLGDEEPEPGTGIVAFLTSETRETRTPASDTIDLPGHKITRSPRSAIGLASFSIHPVRSAPSPEKRDEWGGLNDSVQMK